ncbi:MAG: hypothetical protein SynsKO_27300 [Synoicihabitans sp.]
MSTPVPLPLFLRLARFIIGFSFVFLASSLAHAAHHDAHELDQYGGWTGLKGTATGFFHLEEIEGRNWFVTPDGNVFFGKALSHMLSGETETAATINFGNDKEKWIRDSVHKARAMGFNCALGGASSPERNLNGFVDIALAERIFQEEKFPYAAGVILLKHPWEFVDGETLPDIFAPSYRELIEARAKKVCPPIKDDPLVMGYYYGFGAFNHSDQWVNHHLSLAPGSPGRDAIVDILIGRYGDDVKAFNNVYGTKHSSLAALKTTEVFAFEKALERRNFPAIGKTLDPRRMEDFEAILSKMSNHLYSMAHTAIRRWDKNHLIFGSFIKEWAISAQSWQAAAPFIDVVSPQHLNPNIDLNAIAEAADLPMIVSDEDVGFYYPENKGRRYNAVASHEARGEIYVANMKRLYADPQVVGVSYCACLYDQDGLTLMKNLQNGFLDFRGRERPKLIEHVTKVNAQVYELAPNYGTKEDVQALHHELFKVWEKYETKRR